MIEKISFTVRTADLIKNEIIPNDFVGNNFINDFDNNYVAIKNKQNYFEIYSFDLKTMLGDMYDKYDYFNIILRNCMCGGDSSVNDAVYLCFSISGFDWTNKQNIFPNEKLMNVCYLNDLSIFSYNSTTATNAGHNSIQRLTSNKNGYKTFRKQPIVDFKLFVRNTDGNGSSELTNETAKLYFMFNFDIYPCKNI